MTTVTTVEDLAERMAAEVSRAQRVVLDAFRALANETRIRDHAHALEAAMDRIEAAQAAVRAAVDAEREARATLDEALADADWELDDRFVGEGNKTFLVVKGDTGGEVRKAMTADQRKAWKARAARQMPAVREAERAHKTAALAADQARDELALAEKKASAARHLLDAAAAQLTVLGAALPHLTTIKEGGNA